MPGKIPQPQHDQRAGAGFGLEAEHFVGFANRGQQGAMQIRPQRNHRRAPDGRVEPAGRKDADDEEEARR